MLVLDSHKSNVSRWNGVRTFALALALIVTTAMPAAAMRCLVDVDGANDDPGQKDVTQFCVGLGANDPFEIHATASLDLATISGGTTSDLCMLFDSDGDARINAALCTTLSGSPAVVSDVRVLSCNDSKSDNCSGAVELSAVNTNCTASQESSDPFVDGAEHPLDTVVSCAIDLDEFGAAGAAARLINMGAYSSSALESEMSDAVLPPACGSDADCPNGQLCHLASGECYAPPVPPCTDNSGCGANEICEVETGICIPGCSSDNDCPAGKVCNLEAGVCEVPTDTGCDEDADCADGLICNVETGECEDDGCHIDTDCPVGQVCNALTGICEDAGPNGSCSTNDDCVAPQVCNPSTGECGDDTGPCTSDADCEIDETCNVVSGFCEPKEGWCHSDADCASLDNFCGVGVCDTQTGVCSVSGLNEGSACGEQGTCSDGGICSAGACVTVTACDSECSTCDGGHCLSMCGNPYAAQTTGVTVTDALYILRAAVKLEQCTLCVCDVNDSATITAVDTLQVMRMLVRLPTVLSCPGSN